MARAGWRAHAEAAAAEREAKQAWLAQLAARCAHCDHTEAWHIVDGRCAYRDEGPPCGCEREWTEA